MFCPLDLEEECHGKDSTSGMSYFTVSVAFILMVLNIPGNLLQILAVVLDPFKKLRTPFNFMMTNLAIADLLVGTVTEPMSIYTHWTEGMGNHVTLGQSRVLFMSYFISCTASLLSLATLAVERYLAIRYPFLYRNQLTKRRVVLIAIGIWTISIALSSVYFEVGYVTYAFIFANTTIALTLVIICFMYCLMYRALRTRARGETPVAIVVKNTECQNTSPETHNDNNIAQNGNSGLKHHQRSYARENNEVSSEEIYHDAKCRHERQSSEKTSVPESHFHNLVGHEVPANESFENQSTAKGVITENNSLQQESTTCENSSQRCATLERRITKRFLVVLSALLLCYGPSTILIYAMTFCSSCSCITQHWFRDLQFLLVIANSSINFFAYAMRSSRFRKTFAKILKFKSREHSLGCTARTMADSSTDIINI